MIMKLIYMILICTSLTFAGNFQRETKVKESAQDPIQKVDTVYVEKPVYRYMYHEYHYKPGTTSRERTRKIYKRTPRHHHKKHNGEHHHK